MARSQELLAGVLVCLILGAGVAQAGSGIGLRAGIGTDISGGIAYGFGGNYLIPLNTNSVEVGIAAYGGSFEETSTEGSNEYIEKTDLLVIAATANVLFNYVAGEPGTFFVAGVGLGSINVEWEERSPTDSSLGPALPGGGSMDSAEGSGGGAIFNVGIGQAIGSNFDIRGEVPLILMFSAPGDASTVVPTFTVTAGIRF